MVLVLSEHSNHSTQVVREVERAVSKGIPIVPLRIANVRLAKSLEYFLSTCHWLDAIGEKIEPHLPRLTEAVNATLRKVYDGDTLDFEQRAAPPKGRKSVSRGEAGDVYHAEIVSTPEPITAKPANPPPFAPYGQQQHAVGPSYPPPAPRPTNSLGVAGLTTSIIGIFTCGTFSPIGLLLSLIGLAKAPRGNAIAGSIIGAVGCGIFLSMFCYGFYGGLVTAMSLEDASAAIEAYRADMGELPDESIGGALLQCEKDAWNNELRYSRTWNGYEVRSAGLDGAFDTIDDHTVLR
jgi:hypothetical protein